MLEVVPLRAFADNYLWLIHGQPDRSQVAVVDPGDADVVREALRRDGLTLRAILVTHHHRDHVGGVAALAAETGAPVYGPAREAIPGPCRPLKDGDTLALDALGLRFSVLEVPGHTAGHIAYAGHGALFCGDTLFSGGCGRLFEGTPEQMHRSLTRLAAFPADTLVYCTHEYTLGNLRFARAVEPDNAATVAHEEDCMLKRQADLPTLPSTIGVERRINPFLRCEQPAVRRSAESREGHALPDPVAVFAAVRRWKDAF